MRICYQRLPTDQEKVTALHKALTEALEWGNLIKDCNVEDDSSTLFQSFMNHTKLFVDKLNRLLYAMGKRLEGIKEMSKYC